MKQKTWLMVPIVLAALALSCDDDPESSVFRFDVPCAAVEAGECTWGAGTCDFSGVSLDFCGLRSAPPSCYQGPEEAVYGIVFSVPAQLGQGLTMRCNLVDGDLPPEPANATVCVYPLEGDTCRGPWSFDSDEWDVDDRDLRVRFNASGGAKIVVVDPDGSLCDSLTVECEVF